MTLHKHATACCMFMLIHIILLPCK